MQDTIYALATAAGRSGVAVIRVSGNAALSGAKAFGAHNLTPRMASLVVLRDPVSRETLDKALVLYFKNPASYTGEDTVEYHLHGGRAVIDDVLAALSALPHHRMAEPGEFTRRAFENGKMDLTEAEAIADLIDAQTQVQKQQALTQMDGALARLYVGWTDKLKTLLAHAEADIEFPDEDLDLNESGGIAPQISPQIQNLVDEINHHLNDNRRGERLRDGIHIAVIGAPNAGKSSLVNALARRDVAIVSDTTGTTRDIIEAHLDLGGYPIILADTAGLRPDQIGSAPHDKIESEGIRRALHRAQESDIKILLFDGTKNIDKHTQDLIDDKSIIVVNKIDCAIKTDVFNDLNPVLISVAGNIGIDRLIDAITVAAATLIGTCEVPSLTRVRHRTALENAQDSLNRAMSAPLPELAAEDMRLAIRYLGRITGRVDVEELLDVIFKDFCIGK